MNLYELEHLAADCFNQACPVDSVVPNNTADACAYLLDEMTGNGVYLFQFKILMHDDTYKDWRQTIGICKINDKEQLVLHKDFTWENGSIGLTNQGKLLMRRQRNSLIEIKHSCRYGTGDIVEYCLLIWIMVNYHSL